jgi:hypothetical protein
MDDTSITPINTALSQTDPSPIRKAKEKRVRKRNIHRSKRHDGRF